MTALISILVIVATTLWIGFDSNQRDWSGNRFSNRPWKWIVGNLLLWIIVFPLYLFQRGRAPLKAAA